MWAIDFPSHPGHSRWVSQIFLSLSPHSIWISCLHWISFMYWIHPEWSSHLENCCSEGQTHPGLKIATPALLLQPSYIPLQLQSIQLYPLFIFCNDNDEYFPVTTQTHASYMSPSNTLSLWLIYTGYHIIRRVFWAHLCNRHGKFEFGGLNVLSPLNYLGIIILWNPGGKRGE